MTRPPFEKIFLDAAEIIAKRGTCSRAQVGCVIAVDDRVVATGYNGALPGARHCDHVPRWDANDQGGPGRGIPYDHDLEHGHCSNAVHAETNAVAQAALTGTSIRRGVAYVTHAPCRICYQILRAAGVGLIVYRTAYRLHPIVAASVHVRKEHVE